MDDWLTVDLLSCVEITEKEIEFRENKIMFSYFEHSDFREK